MTQDQERAALSQPASVPAGWKLAQVSDGDIRVYGPDKESWLIRKDVGEGFYDFVWRFFDAMLAAPQAAQPAQADAYQRAIEVRAAQGWKIDGGPVPVLYTDTINEQQVCRDDVWLCKTEHLKAKAAPQPEAHPHGLISDHEYMRIFEAARAGSTKPVGTLRGIRACIAAYEAAAPSAQAEQAAQAPVQHTAPQQGES